MVCNFIPPSCVWSLFSSLVEKHYLLMSISCITFSLKGLPILLRLVSSIFYLMSSIYICCLIHVLVLWEKNCIKCYFFVCLVDISLVIVLLWRGHLIQPHLQFLSFPKLPLCPYGFFNAPSMWKVAAEQFNRGFREETPLVAT